MTDLGEERHSERCRCAPCICRRYLSWKSPDGPTPTLKIARWDGTSGTGESDRAYDQVVAAADLSRALDLVPDPWLRIVGTACRDTPPGTYHPPGCNHRGPDKFHPRPCPNRVPWPDQMHLAPTPEKWTPRPGFFVVDRLKARYPQEWAVSVAKFPEWTLSTLKQACADEMARILGAQFGQAPIMGLPELEAPPEFADAPALRRYP